MPVERLCELNGGEAYVEIDYTTSGDNARIDRVIGVNNMNKPVTVWASRGAVTRSATMPAGSTRTLDLTDLSATVRQSINVRMAPYG